jgi:AraC-like DNA-binding protein
MSLNRKEIIQKVDELIAKHPNVSLWIAAERLGTTEQIIQEALLEVEGVSFKEYQENKRLEQAFKQLGERSPAANGPYEMTRSRRRVYIPKTKVQYHLHHLWEHKSGFSDRCPLVDFTRNGLAFLADEDLKPKKQVSLLLKFQEEDEMIRLKARVVYSVATGIAGYRYRIGIRYSPFAERKGCNSLKILDILVKLEKAYTSRDM